MLITSRDEAILYANRLRRAIKLADQRRLDRAEDAYRDELSAMEAHVREVMAVPCAELAREERIDPPFDPLFPGLLEMPARQYLEENDL